MTADNGRAGGAVEAGPKRPVFDWDARPRPALWHRGDGAERRVWRQYWVDDVTVGLAELVHYARFRAGPIDACSAFGARTGVHLGIQVHRGSLWLARGAARRLRPDLPRDTEQAWLADMFAGIGRTFAEFSVLPQIARTRCRLHGTDHLDAAQAAGRPVILAMVHLGSWEAGMAAVARHQRAAGRAVHLIYQPPPNRFRHWIAVRARARAGITLLPPGKRGTRPALQVLDRGGALILAVDEGFDNYVYGPFLGRRPALRGNYHTLVRLARRTGAAVLPFWTLRGDGAWFDVEIGAPVSLFDDGDAGPALTKPQALDAVLRLDAVLSPLVLTHLQQWYMLHQFRTLRGDFA